MGNEEWIIKRSLIADAIFDYIMTYPVLPCKSPFARHKMKERAGIMRNVEISAFCGRLFLITAELSTRKEHMPKRRLLCGLNNSDS